MGRLFWKFFFFFWLAQVVTAVGVGVAVWLIHPGSGPGSVVIDGGPPPPPPWLSGTDHVPLGQQTSNPRPPFDLPGPLLPIIAGSLASLIFAALLAWYFARPIRNLRLAFESVARGKLGTRIGGSMGRRNDELSDLGKDFDHMAGRLEVLIDSQRRLLHDVSHELRSPLARLQAASDLLRQQPERASEFVERIERDTARMDRLVGELLTLARLDSGMAGKLDEEVELHAVVEDIAEDASLEADSKRCTIQVDLTGPAVVRGNHELLHRAIENVVRNAVRYSPEGGTVTISIQESEGARCVTIADRGPGVAAGDLAAIFDPFFRGAAERSVSGYGLGLAITRRVIEAHGGKVSAANRLDGGLLVTLELPFR
jgi:two-component system OmpR family sensor kinase